MRLTCILVTLIAVYLKLGVVHSPCLCFGWTLAPAVNGLCDFFESQGWSWLVFPNSSGVQWGRH